VKQKDREVCEKVDRGEGGASSGHRLYSASKQNSVLLGTGRKRAEGTLQLSTAVTRKTVPCTGRCLVKFY
jgi:hypothetical protein